MGSIPVSLSILLLVWGAITTILVILVIYRVTLSTREDDELYLNEAADSMMASEQREIVSRINGLKRPIVSLALLSVALLLATTGVWVWSGLKSF